MSERWVPTLKPLRERLNLIAEEVMNLISPDDIFDFLDGSPSSDLGALDSRLHHINIRPDIWESAELAMYLRASSSVSTRLPSWEPLRQTAITQSISRGEETGDIFFGMLAP